MHAIRDYKTDEVRHYKQYPELQTSLSGQFGSRNFPELLNRISKISGEVSQIYFVDTRRDTHFELNGKPVSYKFDMKFISAAHNTDFLKQPIEDEKIDPNADKKANLALFLVEFHKFATTRLPQQS